MKVVAGPRSQGLAREVAGELGVELVPAEVSRFPDGEQSVRLRRSLDGEKAVVVQSTMTDSDLVSLLLLIDAASRESDGAVAVAPYLGYCRQDRVFEPGEPLSLAAVVRAVNAQDVEIVTVEPHSDPSEHGDVVSLSATSCLEELVDRWGPDVVLAPDEGAKDRAAGVASEIGAEHDFLVKVRVSGDEVSVEPKSLSVDGRSVAVVDDIISTGGTMSEAVSMLKDQGATEIYAGAIHGVFARDAVSRLFSAGLDDLAVTDTLEGRFSEVSAAPVIARELRSRE